MSANWAEHSKILLGGRTDNPALSFNRAKHWSTNQVDRTVPSQGQILVNPSGKQDSPVLSFNKDNLVKRTDMIVPSSPPKRTSPGQPIKTFL